MTTAYFTGPCQWAKFKEADKFDKYSVQLALDFKQFKEMKDLGLKNGGKPTDDGKMTVTFRRPKADGAPEVVDKDGNPFSGDIGNGSILTLKLDVETFVSPKHGKVTRSSLVSVRVDELVVYNPEAAEMPASTASTAQISTASPKPRIPF